MFSILQESILNQYTINNYWFLNISSIQSSCVTCMAEVSLDFLQSVVYTLRFAVCKCQTPIPWWTQCLVALKYNTEQQCIQCSLHFRHTDNFHIQNFTIWTKRAYTYISGETSKVNRLLIQYVAPGPDSPWTGRSLFITPFSSWKRT